MRYKFFQNDGDNEILTGCWDTKRKIGVFSKIFDLEGKELVMVYAKNSPWFWELNKTVYGIALQKEGVVIDVRAISYSKGHWTFDIGVDNYHFYFHRGHKKSLFRNGVQVAKYNKGAVHFWSNDSGYIVANSNEDILLLLSLFIMFDMGQTMGADINVDLGKLDGGVVESDDLWVPTV